MADRDPTPPIQRPDASHPERYPQDHSVPQQMCPGAGATRLGARVPVFCALTKATLLVSGSRRMKPHSRCIGFRVSGWKALNLDREQGVSAGAGPHPQQGTTLFDTWKQTLDVPWTPWGLGYHACGLWPPAVSGLLLQPGSTPWHPTLSQTAGLVATSRTAPVLYNSGYPSHKALLAGAPRILIPQLQDVKPHTNTWPALLEAIVLPTNPMDSS